MENHSAPNDFVKAMGHVVLTANAALVDARRLIDNAGFFRRKGIRQHLGLAIEFCQLLVKPLNDCEAGEWKTPAFAESYCRNHLPVATEFSMRAMASHGYQSPECRRLVHIAGIIEANLNQYLDKQTAEACWFGDRLSPVQEMEQLRYIDAD
jgi:hypothetical protein